MFYNSLSIEEEKVDDDEPDDDDDENALSIEDENIEESFRSDTGERKEPPNDGPSDEEEGDDDGLFNTLLFAEYWRIGGVICASTLLLPLRTTGTLSVGDKALIPGTDDVAVGMGDLNTPAVRSNVAATAAALICCCC